ncbi:MAG TPA: FAD-dependent oxidoreductase [Thermodesulfobium narugense]|uniref:Sulfide dehydrogenase (Flavoprotein) subunit SudA n=1 Tax=Thermodesulfobium acidiphilum TaxID=1794699 RepID=A0A2R4VYD8_THEAF|nr:FAD-dependent oxidoreductase [Thermodesulfobium acidiphilum]AWB09569.1 sulfide dehydrogenase (flavoprotein) subunit SudA [Thermodesulfobium acidiphilum]HEM55749.1 FAD-dependent oxidoreductase [Thermodesulfobium narugense]
MPIKERVKLRELLPEDRICNYNEIALGLNEKELEYEANRCLQCKKPSCIKGCPAGLNIPRFIKLAREKKFNEALSEILEVNPFSATCARVCPYGFQCEGSCVLNKTGRPIAIGAIHRFISDYGEYQMKMVNESERINGKVAIIGGGTAGLSAAFELSRHGVDVDIYESRPVIGGLARACIPPYRLAREVLDREIVYILSHGAKIKNNISVGKDIPLNDFLDMYDYVILAVGASKCWSLRLLSNEGKDFFAYSAIEFIENYMFRKKVFDRGLKILIIGGGNTAIDVGRISIREGLNPLIVYRRGKEQMPALPKEIEEAEEEGVKFKFFEVPKRAIIENNKLKGIEALKAKLGPPDESGRPSFEVVEGSEHFIEGDVLVSAIGQEVDTEVLTGCDIHLERGLLPYDFGGKYKDKVFPCGDAVSGPSVVVKAMRSGLEVARKVIGKLKESTF